MYLVSITAHSLIHTLSTTWIKVLHHLNRFLSYKSYTNHVLFIKFFFRFDFGGVLQ